MFNYKAALAAGVALVISTAAHAESFFQLEAGLGVSSAAKIGDGTWYWSNMQHKTPINSIAGRIGIQANLLDAHTGSWVPGLRAHLTYGYFGHYHWSAVAGEDPDPGHTWGLDVANGTCYHGNCGYLRRFDSTGDMMAVSLTLEPYWAFGNGWTAGIEAGPALYRYTWTSFATNLQNSPGHFGPYGTAGAVETFHHTPHWYVGALIGASIGKGPVSLRYNYLYSPSRWEDGVPSGVRGVHMVTLNYIF